eukprot:4715195-Pyramimonas_sp.AAC.1
MIVWVVVRMLYPMIVLIGVPMDHPIITPNGCPDGRPDGCPDGCHAVPMVVVPMRGCLIDSAIGR